MKKLTIKMKFLIYCKFSPGWYAGLLTTRIIMFEILTFCCCPFFSLLLQHRVAQRSVQHRVSVIRGLVNCLSQEHYKH